jgi:hypothetical protein
MESTKARHPTKMYGQLRATAPSRCCFFSADDTGECDSCEAGRRTFEAALVVSVPFRRTLTKSASAVVVSVRESSWT